MLKPEHPSIRPYWHVDLKWICGIIFAVGLLTTAILYILAMLTQKSVIIPIGSQIAVEIVGQHGLGNAADLEKFKQAAKLQPGDQVETLPGIFITKADLDKLSPDQLRFKIATLVFTPYYELGAKGVAARQTSDPQERARIERQAGVLGLLNQSTHDALQRGLWLSLGLLILPLVGLVRFSAGFGRLVSPGIIMATLALPGAALAGIWQIARRSSKPLGGDGAGPLPGLSPESLGLIVGSVAPGFVAVFALGFGLLLAAAIGKTIARSRLQRP